MKIEVLFFASVRDMVGTREMEWEVPEGATVGQLKNDLIAHFPKMAGLVSVFLLAVNAEYADDSEVLQAGSQVAIIPPVSGGRDVRDH